MSIPSIVRARYSRLVTWVITGGVCLILCMVYGYSIPNQLFNVTYSTVLESEGGALMGAKIADDGQWRFPASDSIPDRFRHALIAFEDRDFEHHMGVDISALARAAWQNTKEQRIVSGASTITMQVIRLSKGATRRTVWEKAKEMVQATRLELRYSKSEILAMYAAHAPFGGNVVGLEAAAWRYFGRTPHQLSWAESATLAVLPNAPALIHPGRNRDALKAKRNRLLAILLNQQTIDSLTYQLAIQEPLPEQPYALPRHAPHVLSTLYSGPEKGKRIRSGLNLHLQESVTAWVEHHRQRLSANGIHNAGVIVADVKTGAVLAYAGNTKAGNEHQQQVDVIRAPRSSGSILKPLLYLLQLNAGQLTPDQLVPDIPSQFSGYTPQNFNRTYSGAVPASEALARSLNIPAVYQLQEFGVPAFQFYLRKMGITTLNKPPEHYGLSLILGGGETTLWELTQTYTSLARQLRVYDPSNVQKGAFVPLSLSFMPSDHEQSSTPGPGFPLSEGAIWSTFEAMQEVNRPEDEVHWKRFEGSRKVAWKTGTSFGYRDAWAIGITPDVVVGVWVGNADGEGRPGLTGTKAAAPILFDVFNLLPTETSWFDTPDYELEEVEICTLTGHRAGVHCDHTEHRLIPETALITQACPYHQTIYVDETRTRRLNRQCSDGEPMIKQSQLVLPAVQAWYYQQEHPEYELMPPYKTGCTPDEHMAMQLIYPFSQSELYVPVELDGSKGALVFEVAHREPHSTVYWHLNEQFMGETQHQHQLSLSPQPGVHTLTLVDEHGSRLEHYFTVLE
ncbi:MAG: penicillin-binding protein 1C [Bacteroidota bacterium]